MTEEKVAIELSRSEALVLFDLLARFDRDDALTVEHQSEKRVLWNIHCSLERVLAEPFSPGYAQLLAEARGQVAD